ncbi:hypothetical protein KSS87_010532 [Heliosperma pusillum]|nr:hypothetical protein KSS87_010532 [Heliosperma pusillum]
MEGLISPLIWHITWKKNVNVPFAPSLSSPSLPPFLNLHPNKGVATVQAANDPIAPARGIPRKAIEENENCLLIVTPKGGHLGWVAGNEAPFGAPWTDPCVMDFLQHLEKSSAEASTLSSQPAQPYAGDLLPAEV